MAGLSNGARMARSIALGATLAAIAADRADAFPFIDTGSPGPVPSGSDLSKSDTLDLAHQLQLVNGPLVAPAGGWVFQPRIDFQEILTDNVYQVRSPRQWDAVTMIAPGFSVASDLNHLKLNFTFQPTLTMHVEAGSLNSLTQQYSGTALVTLVDDWLFLDMRAISGVNSIYGGLGGIGGVGASAVGAYTAANVYGTGGVYGTNKNNLYQTSSLSISPYLAHRLGDYGNVRVGYSFSLSTSDALSGFVASPFPTGGNNQQSYLSNEGYFHYDTGDMMQSLQYSLDANMVAGQTLTGSQYYQTLAGIPQTGPQNYTNQNYTVNNQISYRFNPVVMVFASGGWQYYNYNNQNYQAHNGLIWSVGTTLTPGPDASLTLGYNYNYGYYSFNMSGFYNITARTSINAAYNSSVGTQLQYLTNQLNQATGTTGTLLNSQNGGQLFSATNQFGVQQGVYRFDTFTFGLTTNLDRDVITTNVAVSKSTQQGINGAAPSNATSFNVLWTHSLQEDLTMSLAAAYNTSSQSAAVTAVNPGWSHAIITSASLQYQITPSLGAAVRYSFFDRISESSQNNVYQNMLVLGVSKTF